MGNTALAVREICVVKTKKAVQKVIGISEDVISINALFSGEIRHRAEVKEMLNTIEKELGKFDSLPELDFRAGYLTGKIEEKRNAGFITPDQAEQLRKLLYAKYEVIRKLETEG